MVGAGRRTSGDSVDCTAGILFRKKVGDKVVMGEKIATVFGTSEEAVQKGVTRILDAVEISKQKPEPRQLITHTVRKDGVEEFDFEAIHSTWI